MEEKASVTFAMVSRLPKFGGRFSSCGPNVVCNGSTQPSTPAPDAKATPAGSQPNGGVRSSGFSLKWKRGEGGVGPTTNPVNPLNREAEKAHTQLPSLAKQLKSGCPGTPKIHRSGLSVATVANPKAVDKQPSKTSPKAETKLSQSTLKSGSKMAQNGSYMSARTGSESRLARPKLGTSASRSSSQDSLSQFSDPTVALDNIVRSHSFSHIKQVPSPSNQTMTRSFSFNRAVELAKPLANTQLRPPRSSFLKPPQLSNGRVGLRLGGLNGNLESLDDPDGTLKEGNNNSRSSSQNTSVVTAPPPSLSALKKPLFPSCLLTKSVNSNGGSLGFKLARSVQSKQQKPLFPGKVKGDVRPSTAPEPLNLQPPVDAEKNNFQSDSEGSSPLRQSSVHAGSETLEDMSISSASSVDRGETSEEFIDDLDSLGDVLSDGDTPDNRKDGDITQTHQNIDLETTGMRGKKKKKNKNVIFYLIQKFFTFFNFLLRYLQGVKNRVRYRTPRNHWFRLPISVKTPRLHLWSCRPPTAPVGRTCGTKKVSGLSVNLGLPGWTATMTQSSTAW